LPGAAAASPLGWLWPALRLVPGMAGNRPTRLAGSLSADLIQLPAAYDRETGPTSTAELQLLLWNDG
jgi:hypothetical protein